MVDSRKHTIQQISDTVSQLKRAMQAYALEHFDELPVHPAQLALLRVIQHEQSVTPKTLAQSMQLTPGAVSQLLDGLQQARCIVRTADQADRRVTHISLSRHGKHVLDAYNKMRNHILHEALRDISDEELATYLKVQTSLTHWLEANHTKA